MELINVRDLIARYDHAEHAAKANAYFDKAAESDYYYYRKPLNTGKEAAEHLLKFGQLVSHLELYPGVRVLDFGAGTCWSSRMFAYMRCEVTAVDVSDQALRFGEKINSEFPLQDELKIRYLVYDGRRLPVDDGSMDRVVCISCFHHVADQRSTLAEFFRVLRPGGIAAFSEPGPRHSTYPESQAEMKTYGVIENDIDVHAIWAHAKEIGYSKLSLSHMTNPRLVGLNKFDPLTSGACPSAAATKLINSDAVSHENARTFYLYKPGGPRGIQDSRSAEGLSHHMSVSIEKSDSAIKGRLTIRNTGTSRWLPAGGDPIGVVNVAVQLFDPSHQLIDLDYARVPLGGSGVAAGETRQMDFTLAHPGRPGTLVFDAVSEGVAWFGNLGSQPVKLPVPC